MVNSSSETIHWNKSCQQWWVYRVSGHHHGMWPKDVHFCLCVPLPVSLCVLQPAGFPLKHSELSCNSPLTSVSDHRLPTATYWRIIRSRLRLMILKSQRHDDHNCLNTNYHQIRTFSGWFMAQTLIVFFLGFITLIVNSMFFICDIFNPTDDSNPFLALKRGTVISHWNTTRKIWLILFAIQNWQLVKSWR